MLRFFRLPVAFTRTLTTVAAPTRTLTERVAATARFAPLCMHLMDGSWAPLLATFDKLPLADKQSDDLVFALENTCAIASDKKLKHVTFDLAVFREHVYRTCDVTVAENKLKIFDLSWSMYAKAKAKQVEYFQHTYQLAGDKSRKRLLKRCQILREKRKEYLSPLQCIDMDAELSVLNKILFPHYSTLILCGPRGSLASKIIEKAKLDGLKTILLCMPIDAESPAAYLADEVRFVSDLANFDECVSKFQNIDHAAVHPGFGYLSEDSRFPKYCEQHGIVFVGPSSSAMDALGNKANARILARKLGVPVIPGYDGDDQHLETLLSEAQKCEFPIVCKTTDGGGGTGNHIAKTPEGLTTLKETIFENKKMVIEKLLEDPKHIEIQVFSDQDGNVVLLGERDCSIQSKQQKIVEVAPGKHLLVPDMRTAAEKIIQAAAKKGYSGAATCEFLVVDNKFYFLEVNTRIQVEHKPSELVLGDVLDFILMQLHIAQGKSLRECFNEALASRDIVLHRPSTLPSIVMTLRQLSSAQVVVEVRVHATHKVLNEDGTLRTDPVVGTVTKVTVPVASPRGTVELGVGVGTKVDTTAVNPLILLVNGVGRTYHEAISNTHYLLSQTHIEGEGIHTDKDNRLFILDALSKMPLATIHTGTMRGIEADYVAHLQSKQMEERSVSGVRRMR